MGLFEDVTSAVAEQMESKEAEESTTSVVRCMQSRSEFSVRFERIDGTWHLAEAFTVDGDEAGDDGTAESTRIDGPFEFRGRYDGCPHCGDGSIYHCGDCDQLACWDGQTSPVECPWCGRRSEVSEGIDSVESYDQATDTNTTTDDVERASTDVTTDSGPGNGLGRK
jgi:hypothetical protein